jgi:dephospho-CoA kinase
VADSDLIAREIVQPGQSALDAVRREFGEGVLAVDGTLDRGRLAGIVFADPTARGRLEAILHPRIRAEWEGRLDRWAGEAVPVGVAVIPLLFETGAEDRFDAIVCVACSATSQIERLRQRGWTDEECRRRIAAQMAVEEKMKRSRFVVWTEPPPAEHALQLERILASLGLWPAVNPKR